ncbi:MAG: sodium:proton antiporter [Myxococcota bacterium]
MTGEGWTTLGVVGAMIVAMFLNLAGSDLVLVAGLTCLLAAGVVDASEAFTGFSNPAVVTIAAMLVVAAGVRETGALDYIARRILGTPRALAGAQMRVMFPVGMLSAFMNNTPVVAMFVPLLQRWGKQTGISPSMLLIPLSYAAILGGTCTLIGTSTNLLVAGLARERGVELGMFDVTWIGLPCLLAGTLYVVFFSRILLRDRKGVGASLADAREYTIALRVEKGSPVVGQTIEGAGLRNLPQLFLYELERAGEVYAAPAPTSKLRAGDVLRFAGIVDSAVDLRKLRLVPEADDVDSLNGKRRWIEAVVAAQSRFVGRTVRDARFRTRYNAAIIAVCRSGHRIEQKVGDIEIEAGDVLLMEAQSTFVTKHRGDPNFALVSEVQDSAPPNHEKAGLAILILGAMVVAIATGVVSLLLAGIVAAGAMLLTRCLDGNQARRALNVQVLVTVAAAIGIGLAVQKSGAATVIGESVASLVAPYGQTVLLVALFGTTALLAAAVYTATSAALMFPIAATVAEAQGIPLLPMSLLVMVAASTAFSTPVGYAANIMVLGPGGYRYTDFLRMGLPLQVLVGAITIAILQLFFL